MAQELKTTLATHPFFEDMPGDKLVLLERCARYTEFAAGDVIFREGGSAETFYLLNSGHVRLELTMPGQGQVLIQTLHEEDVLGWSWLFKPYRWHFDARAASNIRATAFDGKCIREMCETDHELGYHLMKRVSGIMVERLQNTRLQLLDLYGTPA